MFAKRYRNSATNKFKAGRIEIGRASSSVSTFSPLLREFLLQKQGAKTRSTNLVRALHDGANWGMDSTTGVVHSSLRHILLEMTTSTNLKSKVSAPQPGGSANGPHLQSAQFPNNEPALVTLSSVGKGKVLARSVNSNLSVSPRTAKVTHGAHSTN